MKEESNISWPNVLRDIHWTLTGAIQDWEAGGQSFTSPGHHGVPSSPQFDPDRTRRLFDQGRNEATLEAVTRVIEMGVPWWLLQLRDIATARRHAGLGQRPETVDWLLRSLQIPLNGMAEADYVLRSLWDLAMLDQAIPGEVRGVGEPPAWVWAQITLWFARRINGLRRDWYGPRQDDQLHHLGAASQGDHEWRWIRAHFPAHQPLSTTLPNPRAGRAAAAGSQRVEPERAVTSLGASDAGNSGPNGQSQGVTEVALNRLLDLWRVIRERTRELEPTTEQTDEGALASLRQALSQFESAAAITWQYAAPTGRAHWWWETAPWWHDRLQHIPSEDDGPAVAEALSDFVGRMVQYLQEKGRADDLHTEQMLLEATRAFLPFADPDSADVALGWLESTLRAKIMRYLRFMAAELSIAGREDLALKLSTSESEGPPGFSVIPGDFGEVLDVGVRLGLGMATHQIQPLWDCIEQILLTRPMRTGRTVAAPAAEVWRAIEDNFRDHRDGSVGILRMHGAREGAEVERFGRCSLRGLVVEALPDELLVWEWSPSGSGYCSVVEVRLIGKGAETRIQVEESGCPSESFLDPATLDVGTDDPRRRPWGPAYGWPDDRAEFWQTWLTNLAQDLNSTVELR